MSAQPHFLHTSPLSGLGQVSQSLASGMHIAVTVTVNADRHRIFQALTISEYMETWLCPPGNESDRKTIAQRTADGFRIENSGAGGAEFYIAGSYRVCRRSKMIFTWIKHAGSEVFSSLVKIRLYGDFSRTRLYLSHTGLASAAERAWHQELWDASLRRLGSLF